MQNRRSNLTADKKSKNLHTLLDKLEKRKESKNYTVPLSGAEYSDLCSIFVLPICKDSLLKPFYDKQNGTGKNLCRSSELYRSA